MFKRFMVVILFLLAVLVSGILLTSRKDVATGAKVEQATNIPAPSASSSRATTAPTAGVAQSTIKSRDPVLWIMDQADEESQRLLAVDPQSGQPRLELAALSINSVTSRDGQWRYDANVVLQREVSTLVLTTLDLPNGRIARISSLGDRSLMMPADPHDIDLQLALSRDNRLLVLMWTSTLTTRWYSDVYFYDTVTGTVLQRRPLQVFNEKLEEWLPQVQAWISTDGQRVFFVETSQRRPSQTEGILPLWSSKIAVVNVQNRQVEKTIEVPGEIQADSFWTNATLSPDGRMLYLVQNIQQSSDSSGYRYLAFDTSNLEITTAKEVKPSTPAVAFYSFGQLQLTPDGQYFVGFSSQSNQFQFLKTQTGVITSRVQLDRSAEPKVEQEFGILFTVSPDGKLVYVIYPQTKAIYVLDVERQTIVRSAVMAEAKSTLRDLKQWLVGQLVGTASAKFYAQPGAVLSADGQRLYFVDMKDFESGAGLWGVDTATLKPFGHWLRDHDIIGVQLSADGGELYALSPKNHTLYALDPGTGQVRRAFDQAFKQPYGFVTATTQ